MFKQLFFRVVTAVACVASVVGHGCITYPTSRNAVDAHEVSCDKNTDGCSAKAIGDGCVNATHPGSPCMNGQSSFWYSQGCFIGCPTCDGLSGRRQTDLCKLGKKATLPDYARSVNLKAPRFSELDIYQHNPWSAPGAAPVSDACGLAGGSPWSWNRAEAGNYVNTTHASHGTKGTSLPEFPTGLEWQIGGEAEVQWQVRNNHGGGCEYLNGKLLLCPAFLLPACSEARVTLQILIGCAPLPSHSLRRASSSINLISIRKRLAFFSPTGLT